MAKKLESNIKYDYSPLVLILIYLTFTYFIYMVQNNLGDIRILIYIFIVHLFIVVGYLIPTHSNFTNFLKKDHNYSWTFDIKIQKLLIISMIVTIIISLNQILTFYNSISEIIYYVSRPGEAYEYVKFLNRYPEYREGNSAISSLFGITLTLLTGVKYVYLTLSIYFWNKIKVSLKYLFIITTLILLINSLLIGAMINVGTIFISLIPLFLIWLTKRNIKSKFLSIVIFFTVLLSLSYMVGSRSGEDRTVSSVILDGFDILLVYISHGYEGLEESFELDFIPTFGFTTFRGITSYLAEFFGFSDLFTNSYLIRNEIVSGWPAMSKWSTIYPWLASDISYWLVPILIFFIAIIFSIIWHKTKFSLNPWGILLLGQFFIFWLMIPANNQLFHTLGNSSSFLLILVLYILNTRKKKGRKNV